MKEKHPAVCPGAFHSMSRCIPACAYSCQPAADVPE